MPQHPEGVCTLDLCIPGIALDDPRQFQSTITLRAIQQPPFIAKSLPQYHLLPESASCSLPHASLLAAAVFYPSADSVQRILTALDTGRAPLANPVTHNVVAISDSPVVKLGRRGHPVREVMAMIYVQQQTYIPVPTVHMCFEHSGTTYIVMDRLEGRCLDQALSSATSQHLRSFATQLAGFVREFRTLDPRTMMGSWPSGPYDNLFFDPPPLHEFQDIGEFHSYWIWRLGNEMCLPAFAGCLFSRTSQSGGRQDRMLCSDRGPILSALCHHTVSSQESEIKLSALGSIKKEDSFKPHEATTSDGRSNLV